ncbi:T3SS (YopN, CesT) and YbjN peptide-binding chaperone 1 [Prescottella agglutinans]|uniref:T3SS (YopN, CesT) and YbjN peptide-binding chaperone 1 n=1 Tax=Prescottella agglutinans TaxID=1644129 RepID=UPI003D999575
MFEITSFDEAVDRSWITFRHNLADHLSAMRNDDILILDWIEESTVEGFTPWMQFLLWDNEFVRAEVSSNAYLAPLYTLAPEAENRLCALGWGRPTHLPHEEPDDGSPAFFVDKEQRWADQIAAMTVSTLREIWNVPHPSFLRTEMIGSLEGTDLIGADTTDVDVEPAGLGLDDSAAVVPGDPRELRDLVARTVEQALGFPPELDEDGDVVLELDDQPVFVIAHPDRPLVRVWVPLLYAVAGRTRAAEIVCDLTRRWPGIRFTLDDDRLNASIDISGNPFVPRHLADALDLFGKFAPTVDAGFAARFAGRRFADGLPRGGADEQLLLAVGGDEEEDAGDLPPALMTLLHLDQNGSGALSAHEVAAVCGHDRDAVLEFLKITKEQELSWRESSRTARAEDDSEEADVCDCEARVWAQTHESLRAALRVIALPDPPRLTPPAVKPDQMDLFGEPTEPTLSDANTIEPPDHTARGCE